jgi:hypothetical protein
MRVAVRLGAAAALFAACSIDISANTNCNVDTDCISGYVCVAKRCKPDTGGTAGGGIGGIGGGIGGNVGSLDGGYDGSPPRACANTPVIACPAADPGSTCEETFCGGRLWQNGITKSVLVPYRFPDPNPFSSSYRNAIRAGAAAWTRASAGFVTFRECQACSGRFITVVPGNGDGIMNPEATGEQFLPMPTVDTGGRVSPHRIAHQWGHVLGLSHTYERADRDRYTGFDPEVWCPPGGSGLPPNCAAGEANPPGLPAVTSGTFGVFDGKSKMNGLPSDGICGAEQPDEDSSEPTIGDVSALAEQFFGATSNWSPFRPIGRSGSPSQPLDYQLAAGVDPTGSPAIAELVSEYANPEIFVRGTDDRVYTTTRRELTTSMTAQWFDWAAVPDTDDVDGDPAVVFSWLASPDTLFLAVRSRTDGQIHLRGRRGTTWGGWTSLGAPAAGAASSPALASKSPSELAVLVRGGDGLIYMLACMDAQSDCAASASQPDAWSALPPPPSPGIFVGKPSAFWPLDASGLTVAAVRDDRVALLITGVDTGGSDWVTAANITADLAPDDPDPGVAISILAAPGDVAFFARNRQGLLVSDTLQLKYASIGGVLVSPPAVAAIYQASIRTDVAAIIDDHGHPGVWWRYNDGQYKVPCYYNQPGACLACGL